MYRNFKVSADSPSPQIGEGEGSCRRRRPMFSLDQAEGGKQKVEYYDGLNLSG